MVLKVFAIGTLSSINTLFGCAFALLQNKILVRAKLTEQLSTYY